MDSTQTETQTHYSNIIQLYEGIGVDQTLCLLIIFCAHSFAYDYDIALWLFAVAEGYIHVRLYAMDKPMNFHLVLLICLRSPLNINHLQGCQTSLTSSDLILTDICALSALTLRLRLADAIIINRVSSVYVLHFMFYSVLLSGCIQLASHKIAVVFLF